MTCMLAHILSAARMTARPLTCEGPHCPFARYTFAPSPSPLVLAPTELSVRGPGRKRDGCAGAGHVAHQGEGAGAMRAGILDAGGKPLRVPEQHPGLPKQLHGDHGALLEL